MKLLLVIDMQVDFISGALGTPEAEKIVDAVAEKIRTFDGEVICTRDTHTPDYLQTQEGKNLPVPHCVRDSDGWQLDARIAAASANATVFDKPSFGSVELAQTLADRAANGESFESITLVGICTDICVISNAMLLKAFLPETPIFVEAALCAGVTPESHERALEAMKMCQITVR
ncbi:MAG: cysteine hydrolase [Clostridia bacterium]|nr:cysteine hydrolase [Clostridia bacterium]